MRGELFEMTAERKRAWMYASQMIATALAPFPPAEKLVLLNVVMQGLERMYDVHLESVTAAKVTPGAA